jgi:hypothetical protein
MTEKQLGFFLICVCLFLWSYGCEKQSREQQHTLWLLSRHSDAAAVCVLYTRVLILRSRSLAPLTCWTKTAKHLATLSERTPLFKKSIFRRRRRRRMTFATTGTIACALWA